MIDDARELVARTLKRATIWVLRVAGVLALGLSSFAAASDASGPSDSPISISVVDSDGAPVDGVRIRVRGSDGVILAERYVDVGGRLELAHVRDPNIAVEVAPGGMITPPIGAPESIKFVGRVPSEKQVKLSLKPILAVTLIDPLGASVPASRVVSERGAFTVCSLYFGGTGAPQEAIAVPSRGQLLFRRVPRDREWALYIPWSERWSGTALLTGSRLSDEFLRVQLETGKAISGRLAVTMDRDVAVIERPRLHATHGLVQERGDLKLDGTFSFPPLPGGLWRAHAMFRSGRAGRSTEFDVSPGESRLVIDIAGRRVVR